MKAVGAMLSAGVLPALEQLFRQLPVVSPAHVTAAIFLVSLAAAAGSVSHYWTSIPHVVAVAVAVHVQ